MFVRAGKKNYNLARLKERISLDYELFLWIMKDYAENCVMRWTETETQQSPCEVPCSFCAVLGRRWSCLFASSRLSSSFYKHSVGNLALYDSVSIFPLPNISCNRKTEVDSYSPGPAGALSAFQKPARYHRCWTSLSVLGEKTMFNPQFLVSVPIKIFLSS